MIEIPTLFILGAGASNPYGYPTGPELRKDIIYSFIPDFNNLNGIEESLNAINTRENMQQFINNFDNSSLQSIDQYLALNTNDSYIGKIAITLSILKSERNSCFNEKVKDPSDNWYQFIYKKMTSGFKKPGDYKRYFENKVAFITFNYDRSLEYYLYNSFYHSFIQEEMSIRHEMLIGDNAQKYKNPFPIVHVYGTVGPLTLSDWYNGNQNYQGKFGYFSLVENQSKGIRVIGEDRTNANVKDETKKLLQAYPRILFLGFGYDKDNLDTIDLNNSVLSTCNIYGTAKGKTEKEIKDIILSLPKQKILKSKPTKSATIENKNCYELLREYL